MALAIRMREYDKPRVPLTTDYLTGLPNARSRSCQLDRELARCSRHTTLTVMVSDMDGFKQINDRLDIWKGTACCGCSRTP